MARKAILRQRHDVDGPVLLRRAIADDNQLDITPMIDVTFLLLIFFLVASVPDLQAALKLPPAQYGIGVSRRDALSISIAGPDGGVRIYLAESTAGDPLSGDSERQEAAVRAAAAAHAARGGKEVLIRAERRLKHADVASVVGAASVDGLTVNLAVLEIR